MRTKKRQQAAGNRQRNQRTQQNPKTKHACIVKAHEPTRNRLESSLPKNHEDHIAEKGFNSRRHFNLVHKFIPMPQAMKILDAKASVAIEQSEEHFATLTDIDYLKKWS